MYEKWIGRTAQVPDYVDPRSFAAMDALLSGTGDWPDPGAELPPLWHWMLFQPRAPQQDIDRDGHGRRGNFMPPVDLPRRLFASSEVEIFRPLKVGDEVSANTTIQNVYEKSGSTGRLIFVEVTYNVEAAGTAMLQETRTYVYRDDADQSKTQSSTIKADAGDWDEIFHPQTTHLFRFSALTFNAHRIHYDLPYTQEVEGYPRLIVHGQFVAIKMLNACLQANPGRTVSKFRFQARSPLFEGQYIRLSGRVNDALNGADLWASNETGRVCLSGSVVFAE